MTDPNQIYRRTADDEIDLRELFFIIWRGKWIILATTFVFAVASVIYALNQPNIYEVEAKLAPTEESQGRGGLGDAGGQLGGLAALAGLRVGQGQLTPAMLALEIMQSRNFVGKFIERRDIKADLFAVLEWDSATGELVYNHEIYDSETNRWLAVQDSTEEDAEPTQWQSVEAFLKRLVVEVDVASGLVTLKLEHLSPIVAKNWLDWLIEDINNEMRQRDIDEASRSIEYIESEMVNAQLRTTQQIYSSLMEQQTQTIMLANVRPEYVYRVIDPAVVPERRAKPSRALIVMIGTLLGGFISLVIVLMINVFRKV